MQFTNDDAERMHASHMKKLLQPETAAEEKACESPREELQPEPDPAVTDQSSEAPDHKISPAIDSRPTQSTSTKLDERLCTHFKGNDQRLIEPCYSLKECGHF